MIDKARKRLKEIRAKIDLLSAEIRSRIRVFHSNKAYMERLIRQGYSDSMIREIDRYTRENNEILEANEQALIQQNSLIEAHRKEVERFQQLNDLLLKNNPAECLSLTLSGELTFDREHPFFKDLPFLRMLLEELEATERYEACEPVLQQIRLLESSLAI